MVSKKLQAKAKRMRKQGWSYAAISAEVGRCTTTVRRWVDAGYKRKSKNAQKKYNKSIRGKAVQKLRSSRWLSGRRGHAPCSATPDEVLSSLTDTCAGCGRRSDTLSMDHCHKTGRLRGWLCNECNAILGFARDNRQTLLNLAEYLL